MIIKLTAVDRLNLEGILNQQPGHRRDQILRILDEIADKIAVPDRSKFLSTVTMATGEVRQFEIADALKAEPEFEVDLDKHEIRALTDLLNNWKFSGADRRSWVKHIGDQLDNAPYEK